MGIYLIFICLPSIVVAAVAYINSGPGTTPYLADILTGRCEEYHNCLLEAQCHPYYRHVNCNDVVNSFLGAIRRVDPCATPTNSYDTFLNMVPPITKASTTMFWSGVSFANVHSDMSQVTQYFTVLQQTFPGHMVKNLSWCGSTTDGTKSGLNFTVCPTWRSDTCPDNTYTVFWDALSKMLATQATGDVFVVLNAQRFGGAFSNYSTFARIEAPSLDSAKITNVALYLIPDFTLPIPNDRYRETCTNGTVLYLRNFLMNMNFNVTCEENPMEIMWLQCARFRDSPYCAPYDDDSSYGA